MGTKKKPSPEFMKEFGGLTSFTGFSQKKTTQVNSRNRSIKKRAVLVALERGASFTEACEFAQLERRTFYNWLKSDKKFAAAVEKGEENRTRRVEDALFQNARTGNVTAQIFWLCNRAKGRWENVQKMEHALRQTLPQLLKELTSGKEKKEKQKEEKWEKR